MPNAPAATAPPLIVRRARVVTPIRPAEARALRGREMSSLKVWPTADVRIDANTITAIANSLPQVAGATELDAQGRVLLPGLVDCHTHLCWAGDRLDEWDRKRRGATYQQILQSGGGIMSTVRSVRSATPTQLQHGLDARLNSALQLGTTTIEIKSGYGLSMEHELRMLRAIREAGRHHPGTVVPTALLGHAIDTDDPEGPLRFIERTIDGTLDAVHAEFPSAAIDAFCETGAWSREATDRLLSRARQLRHPIRVHADQFTSLGMVERAIELGAASVDHLEASTPETLVAVADSNSVAVLLPCCGFHLDGRYARARPIIDAAGRGGAVAIATNANPGSAPCWSMPMAIALAVRHCGLTPHEAISAATINPAAVLGLHDRGTIERGARADLVLLRHTDERTLAYEFGHCPVAHVIVAGTILTQHPL